MNDLTQQVGLQISLSIGQHVTYREADGGTRSGWIKTLGVEEHRLVANIVLDEPIVIPARGESREILIYTQLIPVVDIVPTTGRSLIDRALILLSELLVLANSSIEPDRLIASEKNILFDVNRLLEETGPHDKQNPIFPRAA